MFSFFPSACVNALNVRWRQGIRLRFACCILDFLQLSSIEKYAPTAETLFNFYAGCMFDRLQTLRSAMLRIGSSIRIRGGKSEFATRAIHARHGTRSFQGREGKSAFLVRSRKRLVRLESFW